MNLRPCTFTVVMSGLLVAAGTSSGCQSQRFLRTPKFFSSRSQAESPRASVRDERDFGEEYTPETTVEPRLSLPPEPLREDTIVPESRPLPAPPSEDAQSSRMGLRWLPSRPRGQAEPSRTESYRRDTESDDFGLPPARATYHSTENASDDRLDADTIGRPQPRLFRPAGHAKGVFDAVKRKLPWPESP